MKLFMSKAEKAMQAKMAIRKGMMELKNWERSLEKKKNVLISDAQTAKKQGLAAQYALACSGLKMILTQQKRATAMRLQISMVETMKDLTTMSSSFIGLVGKISGEITKITGKADFFKNQAAFEQGMLSMDEIMDQMNGFLETGGESLQDVAGTEEISDTDISNLIDVTAASSEDKVNDEIEKKLKEVRDSLNA